MVRTKTKLKLKPTLIFKNYSHVCPYHCAQLLYTTEHRTVLIICPVILQTIIIAQMLSTGWEGESFFNSKVTSPTDTAPPITLALQLQYTLTQLNEKTYESLDAQKNGFFKASSDTSWSFSVNVALNRSVCLLVGSAANIVNNCSPKL